MKSFNTKLALAAVAIAIIGTPALAQTQRQNSQNYSYQQSVQHYPNGSLRGGAQSDFDSGAEFNQGQ